MKKWIVFVMIFSSISMFACASYRRDLNATTNNAQMYNWKSFDADLMLKGTFFTPDFRQSFIKKHIEIHHLKNDGAKEFAHAENEKQSKYWEFFVTLYTKSKYGYLSNEKDSFWKVSLIDNSGNKIAADLIKKVSITPYEREIFPYINRWSHGYWIRFNKINLGENPALLFQSVVGELNLTFSLKKIN